MATHSSILAWKNPMDRGAWQGTIQGVARIRHNLATKPLTHHIQQNDSIINICYIILFFRFFSILGYFKISSVVPCAMQQDLAVYPFGTQWCVSIVDLCISQFIAPTYSQQVLNEYLPKKPVSKCDSGVMSLSQVAELAGINPHISG